MVPVLLAAAPAGAVVPVTARSAEAFEQLLTSEDRTALVQGCTESLSAGLDERLRLLRQRLLQLQAESSSLSVQFANTRALLRCKAPDAALQVLARIMPSPGPERQQWLELQWRAASAGLDHRRAATALRRLSANSASQLNSIDFTLVEPSEAGGAPTLRSAIDLQAMQLEALGEAEQAARLLQQPAATPAATARRRQQAARLLATNAQLANAATLAAESIDLAASAEAWGLSAELLNDQRRYELALRQWPDAATTNQRRLRLSRRVRDGMGERAALLSSLADGSTEPGWTQGLIDRRDPLERRRGALLDVLLALEPDDTPEPLPLRLARLDLALEVAMRVGHRERAFELLTELERLGRDEDLAWLRDRANRLGLQLAAGNPLQQLEAVERRQRELLADPVLRRGIGAVLDPEAPQRRLERLQRRDERVARAEQRFGSDPFPGSYALPALLEDLARLEQAQAEGSTWRLPPAQFGQLARSLSDEAYQEQQQRLTAVLQSLELDPPVQQEGQQRFSVFVEQLKRREQLGQSLEQQLVAAELTADAVQQRRDWLALEQELDPRGELLRSLAGFGRSTAGMASLRALQQQEDRLRLLERQAEAQALKEERQELLDLLADQDASRWDPEQQAPLPQRRTVALSQQWRLYRRDPSLETALQLQLRAAEAGEEAVELEALRLQLAQLLPPGSADPATIEQLRELELRLRSPLSRRGHLGSSAPTP